MIRVDSVSRGTGVSHRRLSRCSTADLPEPTLVRLPLSAPIAVDNIRSIDWRLSGAENGGARNTSGAG